MKSNKILEGLVVTALLALVYINSHAQTSIVADTIKNTCGEEGTSNMLFNICDSTVMRIDATDYSVKFNGTAHFDTIHAKLIHAGDSSIVLGTTAIPSGTTDFVATSVLNRQITFGWTDQNGSTLTNNFKGVSIGTVPANYLLNLYKPGTSGSGSGVSVFQQFTNDAGTTSANGFRFGINHNASNGLNNVEFRQYENANMDFFTNGEPRMRIYRSSGGYNGNVGIGDFQTNNANYKLHVFGTIGVSDMDAVGVTGTLYPVAWDNGSNQLIKGSASPYGLLSYCSSFNPSNDQNYVTKWSSNSSAEICKSIIFDDGTHVGIGAIPNAEGRLQLSFANGNAATTGTMSFATNTGGGRSAGITTAGTTTGTTGSSYGILAVSTGGQFSFGGQFTSGAGSFLSTGVFAQGNNTSTTSSFTYGILSQYSRVGGTGYGIYAYGQGNGANDWAGFFNGRAGGIQNWIVSDSVLKKNVSAINDGLSIINLLKPKSYVFDTVSFPNIYLPSENQYGLIAQDVSDVLPELTSPMPFAATYDSAGTLIDSARTFTGINYTGLIPITIAAIKQLDSMQTHADTSTWSLHGNSINAGNYIGSNNYSDLRMVTDSVVRMTISKDGDISIENNLDVQGEINSNGLLTVSDNLAVSGTATIGGPISVGSDGYFYGDVYATGSFYPSDLKLKQGIESFSGDSALKILSALQPKTYTFRTEQFPMLALPTVKQYGLISEEVEKVLPTLVKDTKSPAKVDSLGKVVNTSVEYKSLNYSEFIPILIAAVKQLDSANNDLRQQLIRLQNCCDNSIQPSEGNRMEQSTELTNAIILDQNAPNPFAEQTTITFTIPESVTDAKLIFYTVTGNVLKTVPITSRGNGSLLVYASNLSSGIYTYSLIADGQLIDTKKMTKQ